MEISLLEVILSSGCLSVHPDRLDRPQRLVGCGELPRVGGLSGLNTAKIDPGLLRPFFLCKLDSLDFSRFPKKYGFSKLDELFLKNVRFGKHNPPPSYLTTGADVRRWQ